MPHACVADWLRAAACGTFPQADGGWTIAPPWREGVGGVIAFTGHALVVPLHGETRADLHMLGIDGFGGATMPHVITDLAGPAGWIDNLDALLIRPPNTALPPSDLPDLIAREDLHDHPRAVYNRRLRDAVTVYGPHDRRNPSMLTIGRGIGGLIELGMQTDGSLRGHDLLVAGLRRIDPHEPVLVAVAPGNARALRTFLRLDFRPVGSVQLCTAQRPDQAPAPTPTPGMMSA